MKFIRILSLILIITTICSVFASCAGDIGLSESSGSDSTDIMTDENGEIIDNGDINSDSDDEAAKEGITIFANGAYTAKLIRGENATATEKEIYTQIKDLLKKHTGVNPEVATDYAATGTEKYDGPAILIGETSYSESKSAYNKLGNDHATATISKNKYVIAFSSKEAATNLVNAFKTTLSKNATKDKITIDSKWKLSEKIETVSSGNETFDATGLVNSAALPSLGTSYDAGQNSKTYIKSNADKNTFTSLCGELEAKKFKKYTSNSIGSNLFATYVTQTQIVHVMFFPNLKQVRTAVDKRGTGTAGFALTGLSGENKYTKTNDSEMVVCDISNADWPGGMCIIFKLADGRFFIVDAGVGGKLYDNRKWIGSSSGWIYQTLAKRAKDPKNIQVAAWLITHPHSDHAGGLYDMALGYYGSSDSGKHTVMPKEMKQYVKIDKIIYNQPAKMVHGRSDWMTTIIKNCNVKNVVKAHPGQVFYLADLKLTIYGSQDIMIEDTSKMTGDRADLNEQSISARAEFNGKSVLLLGDSDVFPNKKLATIYKTDLKSDMLQLAHHGYGDTGDADVNSYCKPSMILWAVSNRDLRSGSKVNVNTSIGNVSGAKHYKPGTGNLIFKKDWTTYTESRDTIMNLIPKCDGTYCGNKSCTKKSSTKNSYNS